MSVTAIVQAVAKYGPVVAETVGQLYKMYNKKDHGSKVKAGAFAECSIKMAGDQAFIIVSDEEIVPLSSEAVQSCQFEGEKFRKKRMKTYYYYEVVFHDGRKSHIRVSKEPRDAMLSRL